MFLEENTSHLVKELGPVAGGSGPPRSASQLESRPAQPPLTARHPVTLSQTSTDQGDFYVIEKSNGKYEY